MEKIDIQMFKKEFPYDDHGYLDKNDPRVLSAFNNLLTLSDRQHYDAAVDELKREDPNYFSVEEQLAALCISYNYFLTCEVKSRSALFISMGDGGVEKSTSLLRLIELNGLKVFDLEKPNILPNNAGYDVVRVGTDIASEDDFFDILRKYNGKVILFDHKDNALISNSVKITSVLKNIAGDLPKFRLFPGEVKPERFTGKLIFITDKNRAELTNDDDHKRIFYLATTVEIHFTLNEAFEFLGNNYMSLGGRMNGVSEKEEDALRQEIYDFLKENKDKIDPAKFSVSSFSEMLREAASIQKD